MKEQFHAESKGSPFLKFAVRFWHRNGRELEAPYRAPLLARASGAEMAVPPRALSRLVVCFIKERPTEMFTLSFHAELHLFALILKEDYHFGSR
jgi:hypothetical protein